MPITLARQRIFISAASKDYRKHREYLRSKLTLPNRDARTQEDFVVAGSTLLQKLFGYVASCDLVVHLVGPSAGAAPQAAELDGFLADKPRFRDWLENDDDGIESGHIALVSYTQWEAYFALFHRIPLVCFYGPEQGIAVDHTQALHRNRIEYRGQDRGSFTTKEDLATEVLRSLQSRFGDGGSGLYAGHALLRKRDFDCDAEGELPKMASVGRRPTLALLRDEQYLHRSQQILDLADALKDATVTYSPDEYSDLPVFWIGGASGSGKSVLLLQFMKKLVYEDRRILWLDDDVAGLQPVLEAVLSRHRGTADPSPEYIFIDDLYAPRNQQLIHLDALQRTVTANPEMQWPTIVTCGPGQYFEEFRADTAGDGIVAEKWVLSKVSFSEIAEIEQFFSQRSGSVVALEENLDHEEGLFISIAVELRHGNLEAFAKKFADRIVSLDLLTPLRRIIALNRLYISAPRIWLSEHEFDRLASFNEDSEFLLEDVAGDRQYIRLTHPHISNGIYRALCAPANPRVYASDIVDAFDWAMKTDVPTAIAIVRTLRSGNERLDQVDLQRVVQGLSRILSPDRLEIGEWDLHQKADLLTALAVWNAKAKDLTVADRFGWDLRKHASDAIAVLDANAAPLWMALIRSADLDAADIDRVIFYLESEGGFNDPGWHLLFGGLQEGSADSAPQLQQRIVCLGLARLEQSPRLSGSGHVLVHVINWNKTGGQTEISDRVTSVIRTWLKENPLHHNLPRVVRARISVAEGGELEDLINASFKWLANSAGKAKVWGPYFVWFTRKLIQKKDPRIGDFLDAAVKLLDQPNFQLVGSYIVEFARENLKHFGTDPTPALRKVALSRLEEVDFPGWSFFLEYLEKLNDLTTDEKQTVLDLGQKWLDAHEGSSEVSFVWNTLFHVSEGMGSADRRFLVDYGKRLLSAEVLLPAVIPLAANLVNSGLTIMDADQRDEVLGLCTEAYLRAPTSSALPFLAESLFLRDSDVDRLDRVAGHLEKVCRAHLDAISKPDENAERTEAAIQFHMTALRAGRCVDLERSPQCKTGIHALAAYLEESFAITQDTYPVGTPARGVVTRSSSSGYFILLPTGYSGMLPVASTPDDRLAEFDKAAACDAVDVWVSAFDDDRRIYFTAYPPEQDRIRRAETAAYFDTLSIGQKLCCEVVGSANYGVFVMAEHGVTGLLHCSQMDGRTVAELETTANLDLWIIGLDDARQRIKFSLVDPELERKRQAQAEAFASELKIGQRLRGRVVNTKDYGVFVRLDHGLTGLLHRTHLHSAGLEMFSRGDDIDVYVREIDLDPIRIGLSNLAPEDEEEIEIARVQAISVLDVGQCVHGTVSNRVAYGVFVSFGGGASGLLHKNRMGERSMADFVLGQKVELWVHAVKVESRKVELTAINPVVQLERRRAAERFFKTLSLGQVLNGTVVNVVQYGVFFKLGDGLNALLHASKLGEAELADFDLGAVHDVRVIELDSVKKRVALAHPDAPRGAGTPTTGRAP